MAKVSIDLICEECGKSFTHTAIKHNRSEADSYAEWARDNIQICPECWRKQKIASKRSADEAKAESGIKKAEQEGVTLPELTGTPKQIAWAETIRGCACEDFANAKAKKPAWDALCSKTEASWWIDHRDIIDAINVRYLLRELKK